MPPLTQANKRNYKDKQKVFDWFIFDVSNELTNMSHEYTMYFNHSLLPSPPLFLLPASVLSWLSFTSTLMTCKKKNDLCIYKKIYDLQMTDNMVFIFQV